jgi:uncharacterized protein YjdB
MRVQSIGAIVVAFGLTVSGLACGNSTTSPSTVSSIGVSGAAPAVGASSQFTATATMSNGSTQDVTAQATWQSSNTTDATVSSTGLVTAVSAGTLTVQATYQNVMGSDQITIADNSSAPAGTASYRAAGPAARSLAR